MSSITSLELASHRLEREARNGADFEEANIPIMGGCEGCGASLAAYNAYPSTTGFLRCSDCIGELGYPDVEQANAAIFGAVR
jgi:hypothetical protein